ncbi:MAG: ribose 5-phosphate isomerase B [Planctomycetota bacterium]|nr:ribose 5-phosphate isomerase B [Planctomycetota bacterium]
MQIALASDHAGFKLKESLKSFLKKLGHTIKDFGTDSEEPCDYPDFAFPAAESLTKGEVERAILICGSGIGMSICANKVKGVRAALAMTPEIAKISRQHNDSNTLCLAARFVSKDVAEEILKVWLLTEFEGEPHARRISKITTYEQQV